MMANKQLHAQSAMEYLMTYGWAILIVAVVLAVLFSLGVFNPSTFAPKADPGSCRVQRNVGVGPTLVGLCNNQEPKYVESFYTHSGCVGTDNVPVSIPLTGLFPSQTNSLTITWWSSYTTNGGNVEIHIVSSDSAPGSSQGPYCATYGCAIPDTTINWPIIPAPNTWFFYALVFSSTGATLYVNNVAGSTTSWVSVPGLTNILELNVSGYSSLCEDFMAGSMADVQLYNSSLQSTELYALYKEGIGGVPIQTQNLVGWWPLNGDANDYSGNNQNGMTSNIAWSSTWYTSYTQP